METSEITHQILNNSLVLENIFQYLSLTEHLKIIHVCPEFRETIVQIIWRSQCKEFIVTERNDSYLMTLNETLVDYCIKQKDFYEFFQLNKFNVQKLELRNCTRVELFQAVEQFENLSCLVMLYCQISNSNMEEIAKRCSGLKTLTLDRCVHSCGVELVLGQDITVETLSKMASLQELIVLNRYKVKMSYETMQQIVNKLRLSKLSICTSIIYEGSEKKLVPLSCDASELFKNLQHLDIGRFSNRNSWSSFVKLHLPHFENLHTLSIFIDLANCVLINDDIVKRIGDSCGQLRELSFKQCKFLLSHFTLPPTLQELSLVWCWGLTWQNLQQILLEYQLKTFVSINGHYDGNDLNYFYHSDSLSAMTLETSLIKDLTNILISSKAEFPNVTTLRWLNSSESSHTHPQEVRHEISEIFPKLQELQLEQAYLSAKEFQQMTCLQVVKFSLFDHVSWPYLLNLLQSTTLTHLSIDMPSNITCSLCPILISKPDGHLAVSPVELTKNMKFLEIPLALFRNALDFWLDFLHRSHNLKFKFYGCYSHEMFNQRLLQDVLNSKKFPTALKSINICNKNVDCNGIRKSFAKTMDTFEFNCNSKGQYFIIF